MRKLFTITLASLFVALTAFQASGGLDDVISALRSGNATELSRYIDTNVEIALPDKTEMYSRSQATMVLQDFFNNSGVKSFELKHKGDNAGNQFAIGTLQTRSGNYRTTVFMVTKNDRQIIKEIRFQSN